MFLNWGENVITFALGLVPTLRGNSEGGKQGISRWWEMRG